MGFAAARITESEHIFSSGEERPVQQNADLGIYLAGQALAVKSRQRLFQRELRFPKQPVNAAAA